MLDMYSGVISILIPEPRNLTLSHIIGIEIGNALGSLESLVVAYTLELQ